MLIFLWIKLQLFSLLTISIFLEAFPFLLLGALLAAVVEVYVSESFLAKYTPKNISLGFLYALILGFIFPTCECGVVPVTKKLLQKKVPAHIALTYMMAAPVVNPVSIFATIVAFRGNNSMVIGRLVIISLVAIFTSLQFSRQKTDSLLIKERHPKHDHDCDCVQCRTGRGSRPAWQRIMENTGSDFYSTASYLILGACASAFFKTFLPQNFLSAFRYNGMIALVIMLVLAVLFSICSEADAFVAASFSFFPKMAQLGFTTLGPVFDLKLLAMFLHTFKKKAVARLIFMTVILNFIFCLMWGGIFK